MVGIGAEIRQRRTERGLGLRALAARLGVSPATLSAIETGRTRVDAARLADIAVLLEVPVQVLYGEAVPSFHTRPAVLPDRPAESAAWRDYPPLELSSPLEAALEAFVEVGYHGATIRDIARRARLSVPGLYHHYASKHDLLVALLDLTMSDLLGRTAAARAQGGDPVERFGLVVECLALFHTHRRELGFVGASEMRSLEPAARERIAELRRQQQRDVDVEVEAAVLEGRFTTPYPHEASRAVVTMCTALPQWFRPEGPASPEQLARTYVRLALDLMGSVSR